MAASEGTIQGCGNCRHGARHGQKLLCRRFPPTPIPIGVQQAISGPVPVVFLYHPEMDPNAYCGEWAPQLATIDMGRLAEAAVGTA